MSEYVNKKKPVFCVVNISIAYLKNKTKCAVKLTAS